MYRPGASKDRALIAEITSNILPSITDSYTQKQKTKDETQGSTVNKKLLSFLLCIESIHIDSF